MTTVSRDYTGRQLDLECLQTVASPSGTVEVAPTSVDTTSRRVSGMQKAIQRYVTLLLTPSDSVLYSSYSDNTLLSALRAGCVADAGYLRHLFNVASSAALDTIHADDYNTNRFGEQPDDEVISTVELSGVTVDHTTSTLGLSLVFKTKAGSDYAYLLPISTDQV